MAGGPVRVLRTDVDLHLPTLKSVAEPPMQRLVDQLATRILPAARLLIARPEGRTAPQTPEQYLRRPRGRLAASGRVVLGVRDAAGPAAEVTFGGPDAPYARYHHQGTQPHQIMPKSPDGRLRFFSPRAGKIVILRKGQVVHHPGTRPNPYLTDAADQIVGRAPQVHVLGKVDRSQLL